MAEEKLISFEALEADRLAEQATQEGDFDRAIAIYKEALDVARNAEDEISAGFLFRLLMATMAHKEIIKRNYEGAIRVYEAAINMAQHHKDHLSSGFFFRQLADTRAEFHIWHRRFSSAKDVYRKALAEAERLGDKESMAYSQWQMTNLYLEFPSMTTGNHAVSLINKTINMYETELGDNKKTMEVAADMCSTCAHVGNEQGIKVCSDTIEKIKDRINATPSMEKPAQQSPLERPRPKIFTRTAIQPSSPSKSSGVRMHMTDDVRKRRDK